MDAVKALPGSSPAAAAAAAAAAACYGPATTVVALHPFDHPLASSPPNGQCVPPSLSATSPASAASTTSPASVGSVFDPGPAAASVSTSNTSASFGAVPSFREHDHPSGGRDPDGRSSSFSSSVVTAGTSPATTSAGVAGAPSSSTSASASASAKEIELQRKRARDRKSQQAMRDRTKWTIASLNDQVAYLTQLLNARIRDVNLINTRLQSLEVENAQLRTQNAALQLSLMGSSGRADAESGDPAAAATAAAATDSASVVGSVPDALPGSGPGPVPGSGPGPEENAQGAGSVSPATTLSLADAALVKKPWEVAPIDGPPTCLSDQILQGFITAKIQERSTNGAVDVSLKPNLCSLLEKDQRTSDPISDVVGDIVRTYFEIDTLPKQVAVFYIMCTLLKWLTLLNKESWDRLPVWLRPTWSQITTPHAAWIDRIPWPNVRNYLILHPDITLDHFAAVYSTSFGVRWPYDDAHVLIKNTGAGEAVNINPVYEEHIMQLSNWGVGKAFRDRYPEIAAIIDSDALSDQPALPNHAKAGTTL